MTVSKSWKCLWLHLNIIWSSFRFNLLQSERKRRRNTKCQMDRREVEAKRDKRGRGGGMRQGLHIHPFVSD